jgi:AcrR family transcriptional regulator
MPRPDVSAERKPQILNAAAEVFLRKGIDAARMEEIAQEAGLSVGGIYWYFKSKDEVIQALLESIIDPDLHALQALLEGEGSVRMRLRSYAETTTPLASAQLPLTYELLSLASRNEAARQHLAIYIDNYQMALAVLLQQGIDRGEFVPFDVNAMATTVLALMQGLAELAYIVPERFAGNSAALSALDQLLAGITRGEARPAPALRSGGKWVIRNV